MEEKRNVYRLLVGEPEGERQLGRPGCRWIDNIKMDLLEIGLCVVDRIGLAQDRYKDFVYRGGSAIATGATIVIWRVECSCKYFRVRNCNMPTGYKFVEKSAFVKFSRRNLMRLMYPFGHLLSIISFAMC
jgi:hypothetical protein